MFYSQNGQSGSSPDGRMRSSLTSEPSSPDYEEGISESRNHAGESPDHSYVQRFTSWILTTCLSSSNFFASRLKKIEGGREKTFRNFSQFQVQPFSQKSLVVLAGKLYHFDRLWDLFQLADSDVAPASAVVGHLEWLYVVDFVSNCYELFEFRSLWQM